MEDRIKLTISCTGALVHVCTDSNIGFLHIKEF
jgi:hypothetical protein